MPGTFWIGTSRGIGLAGLADKCAARGLEERQVWRGSIVERMQIEAGDWAPAVVQPELAHVQADAQSVALRGLRRWCRAPRCPVGLTSDG